ncbi:MAG: amidohydrolase family protein [Armatimonadota bacterium]
MSALLEAGRAGRPITDFDILDLHGHIGRIGFTLPDLSIGGLARQMDRVGVKSIVVSHMHCMSPNVVHGNREVLKAMRAFPGRILGYISLWPSPEITEETAWCIDQGFTGIKVHNCNGFPINDLRYDGSYTLADEHRLPILFHTWGGEEEFKQIRDLSARFTNTSLLLAHSGCANEEGYVTIARECHNVYLDTAFSRSPRGLVERLVAGAGAQKVVWGSDAYFYTQSSQVGKVLGAKISEEEKRLVLSGNAERILGRRR